MLQIAIVSDRMGGDFQAASSRSRGVGTGRTKADR